MLGAARQGKDFNTTQGTGWHGPVRPGEAGPGGARRGL